MSCIQGDVAQAAAEKAKAVNGSLRIITRPTVSDAADGFSTAKKQEFLSALEKGQVDEMVANNMKGVVQVWMTLLV
jgi:hypothetical protein